MKKGFSLLEVMLAIALSALMGSLLMQILWQLGNSVQRVSAISAIDMQAAITLNILEKDITGIFVPELMMIKDEEVEQSEKLKTTASQSPAQAWGAPANSAQKEQVQKKSQKPEKVFCSKNLDEGHLNFLTFITSNSLQAYSVAKPKVARVVYALRSDSRKQSDYSVLYRYESHTLAEVQSFNFDAEKIESKGIQVARDIKFFKMEFFALPEKKKLKVVEKKDEKKNTEQPEKDEKKNFIRKIEWEEDPEKSAADEEGEQLPLVPQFIKITIIMVDALQRERMFSATFAPNFGFGPFVLEGQKPLSGKTMQDRVEDKLGDVMYDNPLSNDLQSKFESWGKQGGLSGTRQTGSGPVTGGIVP